MKTFFQFITVCGLCIVTINFSFAQDAMVSLNKATSKTTHIEKPDAATLEMYYQKDVKIAKEQILNHLTNEMVYPESLKEHGLEGSVIVDVFINDQGSIVLTKINRSLQAEFDALVLQTLNELKSLDLDRAQYYGANRLRIPVNFSLY